MEKELKNRFREEIVARPPVADAIIAPAQLTELLMNFISSDQRAMAAIQGFLTSHPRGVYDAHLTLKFTFRADTEVPPNGAGGN